VSFIWTFLHATNYFNFKVLDITFVLIFLNISILTIIFWGIMVGGQKFLFITNSNDEKEVFECGFLSINKLKIKPNYHFVIVVILLLIYDIEFFFFIPIFFNISFFNWYYFAIIIVLYLIITWSFIIDWQSIALNWFI